MAEKNPEGHLEPELASHLAESMDEVPAPELTAPAGPANGGQQWPDGSGKHKHPKDRATLHGRDHETAVGAIHRTSRPQLPHHD
ncbi:hypothetical protein FCN77_01630 [Arthrobacter sp. 24S4-2]|uniref:hypothetical protein n=1 Tax=Arthrobacter sp. 24S4-2 TaxID=2575374 RepID=UPI0010C7B463|nr:hypothetical protein [Arthrobacter sp. 24S4-2]QCO96654.1 hypothetical protein FCN77_01630 [Arthrobacter sp. 24S4-2]